MGTGTRIPRRLATGSRIGSGLTFRHRFESLRFHLVHGGFRAFEAATVVLSLYLHLVVQRGVREVKRPH